MKILISGSSGFIGKALTARLKKDGHDVTRLVRRQANDGELQWNPAAGSFEADISGFDAIINLAGHPIGQWFLTNNEKRKILDSRVATTKLLANAIATTSKKPSVFINASAIGYYGTRGDEKLVESATAGTSFIAGVVRAWESATQPARDAGVRVVNIRTGLVLGNGGGLLKRLMPVFKLGLGGKLGSGEQWMSWIHIDDEVGAIVHALNNSAISGPVNTVAPNPVKNTDFTVQLASGLHRPAFMSVPSWLIKLVAGHELADEFTGSKFVEPKVLQDTGYNFAFPTLESALKDLT